MNKNYTFLFLIIIIFFCSCASSKKNYNPAKKYAPETLQKDYALLRNILEAKHPSLYWYTPKEKMDEYFDKFYAVIKDSMTEQQFAWLAVAPLIDKIHCGHTSISLSKSYSKWVKGKAIPSFPLYLKVWNDSMVVYGNLNFKKDIVFKRGTLITSINGIPNKILLKYMLEFLPEDGYAYNVSYLRLSANFPYFHRNIFGLSKSYTVGYLDSAGVEQKAVLPIFTPTKDSLRKDSIIRVEKKKMPKEQKLLQYRSFSIDSTKNFATITLNTFSNGHLRKFFRRSFKQIRKENIQHLILDIRNNGGGKVGMSTLLTKYISHIPFKISDSTYTQSRGLGKYAKYIRGGKLNNVQMFLTSRKNKDGNYHIRRLENHFYQPKKNNYDGKLYVIIGGTTFSASTLFCNAVKGQKNITLVGEETGGGWYGNNGIMIPDITLPNSNIRIRLPLFRMVQQNHGQVKGTGIPPDIFVGPSYDAILKSYDKKMQVVRALIDNASK